MPRLALLALLVPLLLACGVPIEEAAEAEPSATAVPEATSAPPTPTPAPTGRVRLNAVGDVMLARDLVTLMDEHGSLYPFEAVLPLLADADITVANFEGTFTERGTAVEKLYTFRTPPRHAAGLREAGIDVVSLGNNHALDFGLEGLEDTLAALDAAGIAYAGAGVDAAAAGRPAILDANGLTLAFLSYNEVVEATFATDAGAGVAAASVDAIRADVEAALAQADLVIVSLHAGAEYTDAATEAQRSLAYAAIDAGATLVLGHHPHVLQGWERRGPGLIVYSLGNFVFDLDPDDLATLGPRPFQTIVLSVELTATGIESFSARPVLIDATENRPRPAEGNAAREIENRLSALGIPP